MARLNEPPVAPALNSASATGVASVAGGVESVEAFAQMRTKSKVKVEKPPANFDEVKRRFIRQNRELAKNNSSQSLRIRSLEIEVGKLLADNLGLREQVLGLQNEVQNAHRQASSDAFKRLQSDLRAKLAELSGLVDGFDEIENGARTPVEKSRILSPSQRQYRERQPLAELMQDAVMPTITEDKTFPRRTLDSEEIRAIRLSDHSGTSGSPDIGPPPIARFDCEDPIRFSSSQESSNEEATHTPSKDEEAALLPSVNLETRRKRKDSSTKADIRRHSILAQSPVKADNEGSSTMLRTGAKRKLADRETDKPIKPPSQGDFTFSRKTSAEQSSSEGEKSSEKNVKADTTSVPPADTVVKPALEASKQARRVLGEKSVNMSPKKSKVRASAPAAEELKKPALPKLDASNERPPSRGKRVSSIPMPSPQEDNPKTAEIPPPQEENFKTVDLPPAESSTSEQLQPKTPAPDLFSPDASHGSASAAAGTSRDTPPPSDLSSISNTTEGGQRPSRRARSAVNYAEPSLVAKMRRPGKQMVDAISGLQDPRRTMNPSTERKSLGSETSMRTVVIKSEPRDDDSMWKTVPATTADEGSPLRERSTDEHPPASAEETSADALPNANSAATLSSVIASSRKRREQLERRRSAVPFPPPLPMVPNDDAVDATAKKLEELDLYDFKDSSSPVGATDAPPPERKTTTGHRRHSSVPKGPIAGGRTSTSGVGVGAAGTNRAAGRRRSMML